jgi:hypothetical protein
LSAKMVEKSEFDEQAVKYIPAEVHMISGCQDSQTSADVSNVGKFKLPNTQGKAGGACTAALLKVLYAAHEDGTANELSWVELLRAMRVVLRQKGFNQIPQLTSSRIMDVTKPSQWVNPNNPCGTRRAVLIGINYVGQQGQLSGCHNDVKNMKSYLQKFHGFEEHNMTILMDDGVHTNPTYSNIMNAYRQLVRSSQAGDTVFCHYSGHGGRVKDVSGDEDDGYDETLIPVDFQQSGQIVDDDLLRELVRAMPKGVLMTAVMDCCHSGTVWDLPYRFTADGDVAQGMDRDLNVDFDALLVGRTACCRLMELFG